MCHDSTIAPSTITLHLQRTYWKLNGSYRALHENSAQEEVQQRFVSAKMSLRYTVKIGLGTLAVILSVEWLDWLLRRLWSRHSRQGLLKEVLFFPTALACVEHLFTPDPRITIPCPCPLPHGLETSFSRLLRHLLSARASLDLCVFAFSSQELSRAVLLLQARGVTVRVVTDKDYMRITGSQIGTLRNAGICVRHEMGAVHMHHKFAVVDRRRLITGSLNWTVTAIQSNKENILVTEEPDLVLPFTKEFQQLWDSNDPARHYPPGYSTL
ncbi:mitochondrial cardiolipin hydrolase isoform X1 [Conger conger]|uniref:mitochondrial cardiolipin hydrolase isoform X1 n=2 Tax=Conger conger TaxID=82655 RepID=UPI002A5A565F|nr:mitochondrial cardiolipin hydrolase isoform X1 [Conger conger]